MLASLRLAVILIVVLAVVLSVATVLEAAKGRDLAQWYVYGSTWFIGLLGLLSANILAATLVRFPWKKNQIGFAITHAGLLVLLAGSIVTFVAGIEGSLSFVEGETADTVLLADRSQFKVLRQGSNGPRTTEFSFSPGPVNWKAGTPLDFGKVDGMGLKVLDFYVHARQIVSWQTDEAGVGEPALRLRLADSDGRSRGDLWCISNPFGGRADEGMPKLKFQQAPTQSMLEDFLKPQSAAKGELGVLSVHYQDQIIPIDVDQSMGKTVPLGESGISVEIVQYHADAVSQGGGRFSSLGTEPKNPMLQLQIYLPDREEPISEIAFAKNPLVNYSLMRGQKCPVSFWYYHPAVSVSAGAEFMQTPDGKLYCRVGVDGEYQSRGEVTKGDRIAVPPDLEISILDHIPHARQDVTFRPIELAAGETSGPPAAALVELTTKGESHRFWLQRNDEQHGFRRIKTPEGPVTIGFGYVQLPLGFSLKLIDFKRGMNPGGMGDASFASAVQLIDNAEGVELEHEISMNNPLVHGRYTFYQSSFQQLSDGTEASVLSIAYDPGRFPKYLGSLMICVGIFVMFYMKRPFRRRTATLPTPVNTSTPECS